MSKPTLKQISAVSTEAAELRELFDKLEQDMDSVVSDIERKSHQLEACTVGFDCDLSKVKRRTSDGAKVVPIHGKSRR